MGINWSGLGGMDGRVVKRGEAGDRTLHILLSSDPCGYTFLEGQCGKRNRTLQSSPNSASDQLESVPSGFPFLHKRHKALGALSWQEPTLPPHCLIRDGPSQPSKHLWNEQSLPIFWANPLTSLFAMFNSCFPLIMLHRASRMVYPAGRWGNDPHGSGRACPGEMSLMSCV